MRIDNGIDVPRSSFGFTSRGELSISNVGIESVARAKLRAERGGSVSLSSGYACNVRIGESRLGGC